MGQGVGPANNPQRRDWMKTPHFAGMKFELLTYLMGNRKERSNNSSPFINEGILLLRF